MSIESALRELNDTILDLQSADYNTYTRPLRRLAAVLRSADLVEITEALVSGVDFDQFLDDSDKPGGMVGSGSLDWPQDRPKELGLAICLIERGAQNPDWFMNFAHTFYYSGRKVSGDIRKVVSSVLIPFNRDFKNYVLESTSSTNPQVTGEQIVSDDLQRVFVVHGHEEGPRETVARFVESLGLIPIILHEQANRGMTIHEKLQAYANVGFAIVLLTPDDVGRSKDEEGLQPRARQNVILELGYFIGRIGRERVCALLKENVEIPSDFTGVAYHKFDGGSWRQNLARELESAGYSIDWNRVMR